MGAKSLYYSLLILLGLSLYILESKAYYPAFTLPLIGTGGIYLIFRKKLSQRNLFGPGIVALLVFLLGAVSTYYNKMAWQDLIASKAYRTPNSFDIPKTDQARQHFRYSKNIYPLNRDSHINQSWCTFHLGKLEQSHQYFREMLAIFPSDREAIFGKALTEYYQGQLSLEEVLRITKEPNDETFNPNYFFDKNFFGKASINSLRKK